MILLYGQPITRLTQAHEGKQLTLALRLKGNIIAVDPDSYMANRVVWKVTNLSGGASVSYDGVVTGITEDSHGIILASLDTLDAGVILSGDEDLKLQSIAFEDTAVTKTIGSEDFTMAVTGAVAGSNISYYSSDESVATVDQDGKVTILAKGTTTIAAVVNAIGEYQQTSAYYVLTVNAKPIVPPTPTKVEQAIKIDLSDRKAVCGDELDAREVTANGTVTYESSNPDVASVDTATGKIAVHKAGQITITVKAGATNIYKEATVSYQLIVEHLYKEHVCVCGDIKNDETETETETETDTETETEVEIETEVETDPDIETDTDIGDQTDSAPADNTRAWIVVAVAAVLLGGAAIWFFVMRRKKT